MAQRWEPGEVIVRREVLGLVPPGVAAPDPRPAWYGRAWLGLAVHVVEDTEDHLVTYIGPGAQLELPAGDWPTPDGRHPWHGRRSWTGHGCLMVQRHGEDHAIWHFWDGPERTFTCWYVNLQTAARRTGIGYDTQDHELDIVVAPDGTWAVKDLELMPVRVDEGRFTRPFADRVIDHGRSLVAELAAGRRWWDPRWAGWEPDRAWRDARLPGGWAQHPAALG